MSKINRLAGLWMLGAMAFVGQAQDTKMKATIPFDFYAGSRLLPAGDYDVVESSSGWLTVREANASKNVMSVLTNNTISFKKEFVPPQMVFNRYGNTYFLSKVWNRGSGREIPRTAREKILAKSLQAPASTTLVAQK